MALNLANPVNRQHPLNVGLVSRWMCVGNPYAVGLALRDLCKRNDGGLQSGATFAGSVRNGANAVKLPASSINDRVTCTATGLPTGATSPWSLAYWHYTFSYVSLSVDFGFGYSLPGTGTAGANRYSLEFNNNYYLWGDVADFDTGIAYITGSWNHVCFTSSGSNVYFYLNGALRASAALPAYTTSGSVINIGSGHPSATSAPNALINDGCIWSRQLSDSEVSQWYKEACLGTRSSLLNQLAKQFITTPPAAPVGGPWPFFMDEMSGGMQTLGMVA